jgi:hypothetical protein
MPQASSCLPPTTTDPHVVYDPAPTSSTMAAPARRLRPPPGSPVDHVLNPHPQGRHGTWALLGRVAAVVDHGVPD